MQYELHRATSVSYVTHALRRSTPLLYRGKLCRQGFGLSGSGLGWSLGACCGRPVDGGMCSGRSSLRRWGYVRSGRTLTRQSERDCRGLPAPCPGPPLRRPYGASRPGNTTPRGVHLVRATPQQCTASSESPHSTARPKEGQRSPLSLP